MVGLLSRFPSSPVLLAWLVLCSCGGHKRGQAADPSGAAPAARPDSDAAPVRGKLVLVVVLDQLSSEALATYAPHLSADGAIRRAIDQGIYRERVRYDYAGTNTAPGHASIFTGELPKDHGVDSNDLFDYESARKISMVVDNEHPVFGTEDDDTAGPGRLLRPTVGDLLHQASPKSKVVALSVKARAAVAMGGKSADFAGWYDSEQGLITTSTYYADALPAWLATWNAANPVEARLTEWTTDRGELYETLTGPDDSPGECSWSALSSTFPHDMAAAEKPRKAFVASPQSAEYLCDLAATAAEEFSLGQDAYPDLLALSISSTDYAGHCYSWQSWEYADVLYKADLALGNLIRSLERRADVSVLITSDHGGTPLAESLTANGRVAGRVDAGELVTALEALADKKLGAGDWIADYIQPYLWLNEGVKTSGKRDALLALIAEYVDKDPSIHIAVPTALARTWVDSEDAMQRDIANTVAAATDAIFVVPAEGFIATSNAKDLGTGHGTPWAWDREVPVLAFGSGIPTAHTYESMAQNRVAPTIAQMLGLPWPLPAPSLLPAKTQAE